jgi:hypothetical protein
MPLNKAVGLWIALALEVFVKDEVDLSFEAAVLTRRGLTKAVALGNSVAADERRARRAAVESFMVGNQSDKLRRK